jgi:hypothetical protein
MEGAIMCKLGCSGFKLHPFALGVACGITKGLFLMLFAWTAMYWNYGLSVIAQISEVYHGFDATFVGGLYGGGWGILVGFLFGLLVGCFYNLFVFCCRCSSCRTNNGCGCTKERCSCSQKGCACSEERCSCTSKM